MISKNNITLLFLLFAAFTPFSVVNSENLYKSVDKDGKVIYSSKPLSKDAKPANLPPIMRGEVKVPPSALVSCKDHGGLDCQAGSDSDGSVICTDGFRDSAQRYRFSCSAPKLEISNISDIDPNGNFSVHIRNSKTVTATEVKIIFKSKDGNEVVLNGPAEIEAFGGAEYSLMPPDTVINSQPVSPISNLLSEKPKLEEIIVKCSNCPV